MKRVCLLAAMALVTGSIAISGQIPEPLELGERILWVGNILMDPCVNGAMAFVKAAFPQITYTVVQKGKGSGVYKEYWEGAEAAAGTVQKIQEGKAPRPVCYGWQCAGGVAEVAIRGAGTATLELLGMDGTAVYRTDRVSRSALVPLPRIAGTFILRATTEAGSVNRRVILVS